jgi:YbgC/YbaW family acyl-CoA thioester hydrolase
MFDVKLQTYWGDSDAVGIVFFPNYFKFVAQAEEEFYRAAGIIKDGLMDKHQIWLPRVEVFAKFTFPIRNGAAIRVRLNPSFPGEKSVRYDFDIQDEKGRSVSEGYVTAVCVDRTTFEPKAIPEVIRNAIAAI